MKIKFTRQGRASLADIAALENKIGARLAPEYAAFVLLNDGAQPEANLFPVGASNESNVRCFLAVKDIPAAMRQIENLPPQTFPIAVDDCGNSILLSAAGTGALLFWDHEQPGSLIEIAPSFTAFLELLEPFDIDSVELKPGQVKKVWVDPKFLKSKEKRDA